VTISGSPQIDPASPKNGMVIDFSDLKLIVKNEIINVFDHSIVLSKQFDKETLLLFPGIFGNTVFVDYQPTCENLVLDFAGRIRGKLPETIKLYSLKLYETANSYAEWFASDNQ
jgi:6-pyruvoyltetrahydropterin/6-carboxytetrahydropterin synthase